VRSSLGQSYNESGVFFLAFGVDYLSRVGGTSRKSVKGLTGEGGKRQGIARVPVSPYGHLDKGGT